MKIIKLKFAQKTIMAAMLLLTAAKTAPHDATDSNQEGSLFLILSVIWEGESLYDFNLAALEAFRNKHPKIPVMHFISPAYFSRFPDKSNETAKKIKRHIRKGDQVGLSMQAWKSLVTKAGVVFKSSPTFWGNSIQPKYCPEDCGKEVPLGTYSREELKQIFAQAGLLLKKAGFTKPQTLFVSGWMASRQVIEVAVESGISYDFSAISSKTVSSLLSTFPLHEWIGQTWPNLTDYQRSFTIQTAKGPMMEIGNSGATIDYLDKDELLALTRGFISQFDKNRQESLVLHVGIHQETAMQFLPRLELALPAMFTLAEESEMQLTPIVLPKNADANERQLSLNSRRK